MDKEIKSWLRARGWISENPDGTDWYGVDDRLWTRKSAAVRQRGLDEAERRAAWVRFAAAAGMAGSTPRACIEFANTMMKECQSLWRTPEEFGGSTGETEELKP